MIFKRPVALILSVAIAVSAFPTIVTADSSITDGRLDPNGTSEGGQHAEAIGPYQPVIEAQVGSGGDAWEISLYVASEGVNGVSFMMYGDNALYDAKGAIRALQWGASRGQKWSTNASGGGIKKHEPKSPKFSDEAAITAWGSDPTIFEKFILQHLDLSDDLSDRLKKTAEFIKNPPADITDEELQQMLEDGELVDFTLTMEPMLVFATKANVIVNGSINDNGIVRDIDKRQEFYSHWYPIGGRAWTYNFCDYLSIPRIAENVEAGAHNCPHDWKSAGSASWTSGFAEFPRDNYYIFTPTLPTVDSTPPPPPEEVEPEENGYPEIHIKEQEMIANFVQPWEESDTPEDGNKFASTLKEIKIREKNFELGGLRVHDEQDTGTECGKKIGEEPDDVCTEELVDLIYCDQRYKIVWDKDPVVQFDEEDLYSEANVTGSSVDQSKGFSGVDIVNKYQMTRKDGTMDMKFCEPGTVLDSYTFNNANPAPQTTIGGSKQESYTARPGWAKAKSEKEPFRNGFTASFNSHRFSKWVSDDPLTVAGTEEQFIPLAGYMMDTDVNKTYEEFVDDRDLLKRIEWELNEENQTYMQGMYNGHPGRNITWGHGGDYGTCTDDSDVIWENEWNWVRTAISPAGTDTGICPSCDGQETDEYHSDTCDGPNRETDKTAAAIQTPRALFARTLIVDNTIHGEAKQGGEQELQYFLRPNEYGNDRVTFMIPSTVFEFSPTYKMYADYELNCSDKDYTDIWCLASDVDKVQFIDLFDVNLIGGTTTVRAPWSRDYEDQGATDPNTKESINVLKGGNAYHVDTTSSIVQFTGVVHYYDLGFFEPGSDAYKRAAAANAVVDEYINSINACLDAITDGSFGYYTNLVGGTTYGSKYRIWGSRMNPEVFNGKEYTNKDGEIMKIPDPKEAYPKLQLTPNTSMGYVRNSKRVTHAARIRDDLRLDGYWSTFDSPKAAGNELWTDGILHDYIPDVNIDSNSKLRSVLINGKGNGQWYTEDYEGIRVCVIQGYAELPGIRSNVATVYEKLSDFKSSMNTWSPQLLHPIIEVEGTGIRGGGNAVVIKDGSIGAGTYLDIPQTLIYPGGVVSPATLQAWSISYKPDLFGLRGSVFDLS